MAEQLPPIDIGKPEEAPSADNPFAQFVTPDEQPSLLERAKDTAVAHWYSDTLTGSYAGALQADAQPKLNVEAAGAMAGDIIGAQQTGQPVLTPDDEYELRLLKATTGPKLTDAQVAQIRNNAYPEAASFGERAADIAGAVAGGLASPEAIIVPALRAPAAIAPMAAKMTALMPGVAQRMLKTGAEQAVVTGLSNPFVQANRIHAGLQREFDPFEMGMAPIEGFVAGAALHGLFEVAGMGAKIGVDALKNSTAAQSIMAGFESRLQENFFRQLKEVEPGFLSPDDATNMPRSMDGLFPKKPVEQAVAGDVTTMSAAGETGAARPTLEQALAEAGRGDEYPRLIGDVENADYRMLKNVYDRNPGLSLEQAEAKVKDILSGDGRPQPPTSQDRELLGDEIFSELQADYEKRLAEWEAGKEEAAGGILTAERAPPRDLLSESEAILAELENTPGAESFASGVRSSLANIDRMPLKEAGVDFWRSKLEAFKAQAGEAGAPKPIEDYGAQVFFTSPKEKAAFEAVSEAHADVLSEVEAKIRDRVAKINEAGFKVNEIDSFNAASRPDVRGWSKDVSSLGGALSRLAKAEEFYKRVSREGFKGKTDPAKAKADVESARAYVEERLKEVDQPKGKIAKQGYDAGKAFIESEKGKALYEKGAAGEGAALGQEPTYEPGADNLPQAVIPGAERATDKTMAELRANAPMRGGNAPAGGMFDEANTNQGGLQFRRAASYPPEQAQAAALAEKADGIVKSLHQQAFDLADLIGRPLRAGRVDAGALGQFQADSGVARVRAIGDFDTVVHELGHALEEKVGAPLSAAIQRHALELAPLDPNGTGNPAEGFAEWMIGYVKSPNGAYAQRVAPSFFRDFGRALLDNDPTLYEALMKARDAYQTYINAPAVERGAAVIVPMEKQGWFRDLVASYKRNGVAQTIGRVLADSYTALFDQFNPLHKAVREMTRMAKAAEGGAPIDLKAADNPEVMLRMVFNRAAQGAYHQMRYGIVPYKQASSVGPNLHDAIALATGKGPFMGHWDEAAVATFSEFLTAKRALVLWEDYRNGKLPNEPTSLHEADWRQIHDDLLAANPNFERASQMVHGYTRNMLDKLLDAGIIKKELHDELTKTPFYVPMFRDMSDKPLSGNPGGGSSAQGPGQTKLIHRMRGSTRDIIDPLQSIMQQTYLAERTIRHNDLIQSLVNLARRAGSPSGYLVEEVKPKDINKKTFDLNEAVENAAKANGLSAADTSLMMTTMLNVFGNDPVEGTIFWREPTKANGEPIVFYKDAGELKAVRFSTKHEGRALYEAVMTLPSQAQDLLVELLAGTTNVYRTGIVMHPSYFLSNLVRDQIAALMLRSDYIPGWDAAKGIWSELKQDDYAKMYAYIGGQSAGGYVNEPTGRANVSDLGSIARRNFAGQHFGLAGNAKELGEALAKRDLSGAATAIGSMPKSLIELAEVTQLSEAGTRNSIFAKTYEKSLANGLSPYEAMIEAAWAGTDLLDFSRHGARMEAIRRIVPFLNAGMQGLDKMRRALIEPISRGMRGDILTIQEQNELKNAWAMLTVRTMLMAVAGAMWAAINSGNEIYRDADAKTKATHYVFGWGSKSVNIPKSFELALPFTAGEYAYEAFVNKDQRAAGNFATAAHETLTPINPLTSIPLINEYYAQKTGIDTYTGRPIVPENMQRLSAERQFNERTSPTAITIANVLNEISEKMGYGKPWSPIKVEHFFGGGFGTMGRELMAAGHWFSPSGSDLPSRLDQSFILRRWIKDPTRSSDTIQRYYAHASEKTGDYNTALADYNDAIKLRNMNVAQQLYRKLPEDRKAFIVLNAGGDEDGAGVFNADAKNTHPLTRARLAVKQLNDIAREISSNRINNTETDEQIKMTPEMRRSALDAVHQLAATEMRNSMVLTKEPGYEGRPILDVSKAFGVIEAASPELAQEIARRYAMAKVFTTEAVAKAWPSMRRELVRSGSAADIESHVDDVTDAGYEFSGEHAPRKRAKRLPVMGEAVAP